MDVESFIKELRDLSKSKAVLVEGKRDKEALQKLGVKNIYTLAGKRFTDLPDLLEGFSEVILLFDLDKQGEKIHKRVKDILSSQGYILIEEFRSRLKELGLTYVEELYEKVRGYKCGASSGQADKTEHKTP